MTESVLHPVFLYCELHVFLAALIVFMMINLARVALNNEINRLKILCSSFLCYAVTILLDMTLVIFDFYNFRNVFVIKIIVTIWFIAGTVAVFLWFLYTEKKQNTFLKVKRSWFYEIACLPAVVNILLITVSAFSGTVFKVTESGIYERGDYFFLYSVFNAFYLVIVPIHSLYIMIKSKLNYDKKINLTFILFSVPIFVTEIAQSETGRNLRCVGITASLFITFTFLTTINEKKKTKLVEGLTMDFEDVFVVDVDEDVFYSIIRNDKNKVSDFDIHGQCYSENILEYIKNLVPIDEKGLISSDFAAESVYERLKTLPAFTSVFRIKNLGNKDVYYSAKFGRIYDETGRKFILGLRNADAETRSKLDVDARELLRNDLISVLSQDYIGLFFFNLYDESDKINSIIPIQTTEGFVLEGGVKTVSEVFGKYIQLYVHPDDKKLIKNSIKRENIVKLLATKRHHSITFRRNFDGKYKYVEMMIAKVEDVDKPPRNIAIGFSLVDEDYRKKLAKDEEIREALLQADKANESKTEFLFNMSHDIRTPMNAIQGFTELAIKHVDDKELVYDYLKKINKSSQLLLDLINDILDMARVEKGQIKSEMQQINIFDLCDTVVSINQEDALKKNIHIVCVKKNIKNGLVYADELHVSQILINILSNAIKYTPDNGTVIFTIREIKNSDKGTATFLFTIEDNGIGMSAEFIDHIFDSFSRENNSTVSGIQGTGLGMAIVKRLVEHLEGDIKIESEPGRGTVVNVELGFKTSDHIEKAKRTRTLKQTIVGKNVLVVEDNELNREIVVSILNEEKVNTFEASNGKEAVEIIKMKGPLFFNAVLMDIQMPVMGGYEAANVIREMEGFENLPIIALSANAFDSDRKKSLKLGMNAHIAKPINVKELLETLKKLCT